jgi:hypothetical protein
VGGSGPETYEQLNYKRKNRCWQYMRVFAQWNIIETNEASEAVKINIPQPTPIAISPVYSGSISAKSNLGPHALTTTKVIPGREHFGHIAPQSGCTATNLIKIDILSQSK